MTVASFTSCYDKAYFLYFPYQPWCLAASGEIEISVEGGVAPYTWAVSGSVFTLASAETAAQANTITAESDAVAGDEETITITDACGTEVTGTIRCCDSTSCCVNPDYAFSRPNASVYVSIGAYTQIHVQGGCSTYSWVMSGVTPSKITLRDATTNSNFNMIKCASDAAANETLTVTDGCGEVVTITIVPSEGPNPNPCSILYYVNPSWNDDNAETVAREGFMTITIDNGYGPFTWAVSGTGFSLADEETALGSNDLSADETACGTATVTVTDACGESTVTGYVRCTTGEWVTKSNTCVLTGGGSLVEGTMPNCSPTDCKYVLTQGNKRQTQSIHAFGMGDEYCADETYSVWCATGYKGDCWSGVGGACIDCNITSISTCDCYTDYVEDTDYCFCTTDVIYEEWECGT